MKLWTHWRALSLWERSSLTYWFFTYCTGLVRAVRGESFEVAVHSSAIFFSCRLSALPQSSWISDWCSVNPSPVSNQCKITQSNPHISCYRFDAPKIFKKFVIIQGYLLRWRLVKTKSFSFQIVTPVGVVVKDATSVREVRVSNPGLAILDAVSLTSHSRYDMYHCKI